MNRTLNKQSILNLGLIFLILMITSCASTKNVPYFQDISLDPQSQLATTVEFVEPIIKIDDILSISIFTLDANTNMTVNQIGAQAISGNLNSSVSTGATPPTAGFLVDKNGEIVISVIGKIKVAGLTTFEAREAITKQASSFYKDPNVQIRFANFKVTILGEVLRPSSYIVPNEKVTILDALGLAGDLTIFGRRENIILVRDNAGRKEFARINLNSKEVFNSPYFYLKQNDVIYVEPNKGKAASLNTARTQTIAIIGTAMTVIIALISRL
jgi:polysaccharide export outer membrane protein